MSSPSRNENEGEAGSGPATPVDDQSAAGPSTSAGPSAPAATSTTAGPSTPSRRRAAGGPLDSNPVTPGAETRPAAPHSQTNGYPDVEDPARLTPTRPAPATPARPTTQESFDAANAARIISPIPENRAVHFAAPPGGAAAATGAPSTTQAPIPGTVAVAHTVPSFAIPAGIAALPRPMTQAQQAFHDNVRWAPGMNADRYLAALPDRTRPALAQPAAEGGITNGNASGHSEGVEYVWESD